MLFLFVLQFHGKKKVSLENILRKINKANATNIDTDTLTIDVDNMLRNGMVDQDYKILKNHIANMQH